MDSQQLNRVFGALADPTRRLILERLSAGEANVSTLVQGHDMSQPAISKHLRVLEKAGLIRKSRRGRHSIVTSDPQTAAAARDWIEHYVQVWHQQFDTVERLLKTKGELRS